MMLNLRNIPNFYVTFAISTEKKRAGCVHNKLGNFFSVRHFKWNFGNYKSATLDHAPSTQKSVITATHHHTRLILSINFRIAGKLNDNYLQSKSLNDEKCAIV